MPRYTPAGAERYGDKIAQDRWRARVLAALKRAKGNRREAAKILGVSLRTIMRWLAEDKTIKASAPEGHHVGIDTKTA